MITLLSAGRGATSVARSLILGVALAGGGLAAQTSLTSRPIPDTAGSAELVSDYTLTSTSTKSTSDAVVVVTNESDRVLTISGVQCTEGVFIVDYPRTVPAKGSAKISIIAEARLNTDNDYDLIRLRTDQGQKLLRIKHDREKVLSFDRRELTWSVGEAATTKYFTVTLSNGGKVTAATAYGGASAKVESLGNGQFRVGVTPASTAKSTGFPVILALSPEVPGEGLVVSCTIKAP